MTTKVTFKLPSEFVANASDGVLVGEFNNWNPAEGVQLQKEEDGSMFAEVALIAGKSYQYRYLLNDGRWVNDNTNTTWSDVYGNSVENCVINVPVAEKKKAASKAAAVKAAAPKVKAPKKEAALKVTADDLTKIEGVGKKIADILKKEGITSFKDLGKATNKNLKVILDAAGSQYNMHNPLTWPKQAKLAAAGKWDELSLLQAELNGGK